MKLKILILPIIISLFCAYPAKIFAGIKHNKNIARHAIAHYFCHNNRAFHLCATGRQALNVADCETGHTFNVYASNGQYLGIFQMGSHERSRFGFNWNAWDQAQGAKNYYDYEVRNGSWGWRPWSCQPW